MAGWSSRPPTPFFGTDSIWQRAGFHFGTSGNDVALQFPIWLLGLVSAVPLALPLRRIVTKRRRVRSGLCPDCGYDLRASPARCPECGRPTTAVGDARSARSVPAFSPGPGAATLPA